MDLTSLLNWIGSSIGSGLGSLVSQLTDILQTVWDDLGGLRDVISQVASWVWDQLSALWDWLQHEWQWLKDHILGPLLAHLKEWETRLKTWLKPLTDLIKKLQALQRWYWEHIYKPLLDRIQKIRQFLVIFRILGFSWANQLDSYLVKLETQLQQRFMAVWANLNILSEWINFIVDPFGALQPSILVGSVFRSIGLIFGVLWNAQSKPLSASDQAAQQKDAHQFDRNIALSEMHAIAAAGNLPETTALRDDVAGELATMGYV